MKISIYFINLFFLIIILSIYSCSPKQEPEPASVNKIEKVKTSPGWLKNNNFDKKYWYGIGTVALKDSIDPMPNAILSVEDQIESDIKKLVMMELNINENIANEITNQIIKSRSGLIGEKIEKVDSSTVGKYKNILIRLDKNKLYDVLNDKLIQNDIGSYLSQINGPPSGKNFSMLSKSLKMIIDFIDVILMNNKKDSTDHINFIQKSRSILIDYNKRIQFLFDPIILNKIPISNDDREISVMIRDKKENKNLDSIHILLNYSGLDQIINWVSNKSIAETIILQKALRQDGYVALFSVDFKSMLGGSYLDIFNIPSEISNITVLPKGTKISLSESISNLGTGINYSMIYDSIGSCFSENYFLDFVDQSINADIIMRIQISTQENMRRKSRRTPFKSLASFILNLESRENGNNIFSHTIAQTEVLDYDFIERASIKALKGLAKEVIFIVCN